MLRRLARSSAVLAVLAVATLAGCGHPVPGRPAVAVPAASHHFSLPKTGIKHVFLIVLENESYAASYQDNPNPWLGKKLQRQGTLLTHYFATGHVSLDNYLSMMSGQAPNPQTSSDCLTYTQFNGTTADAELTPGTGQAVGVGCIYPQNVKTLPDQLMAHHITWGGYMDQMGAVKGRERKRCGIPTISSSGIDDTQSATAKDQYAARHNPFVYFHSLIDSGQCKKHVVPLTKLPKALRRVATTPRFTFITPSLCNDGHDHPCKGKDARGKSQGGLVSVDHFLSVWIPRIKHSAAYRKDGVIIVTTDESGVSDSTSCCNEQPGPSGSPPGISGPGGGRTGTLVIGRCVRHGAKDSQAYNHYSLLRSLEDMFRIRHGGADGNGHLGYAAAKGLRPFGSDLFRCRR
ncbi:MAG: hypothetical protein JO246_15155 [Frankiaceae bacterium]|nr:hypothetical protein [Frankiaceae bacterium]MBV9871746.1 hypothetical protein [Frankiaceae bacterium]